MFKTRFRPVQEELRGPLMSGLFCCVWYMTLSESILRGNFSIHMFVFLLAGLIPFYKSVNGIWRVYMCRKQKKNAVRLGNVRQGKIVNVIRTTETQTFRKYAYYYYFEVEITDPVTGIPVTIRSDAYRKPIYQYLGSPYVQVYIDKTGWKYYLEDFQMKEHHNDPDIFPGGDRMKEPLWTMWIRRIFQFIFLMIIVGILVYDLCVYSLNYAISTADRSESPGGKYTLLLQSIGSPVFFSSADVRLVLKEGREKISTYKFVLSDDGRSVRSDIWKVSWKEDHVEIIISGDEQSDELIKMYYNGDTYNEQLEAHWEEILEENETVSEKVPENEQIIQDGYQVIYNQFFEQNNDSFIKDYDAKGHTRIILHEDNSIVEYLVYDRQSSNGNCGLYVYYRSQKDENGSWSPMDASILEIYAYVYDTKDVISSGKTHWEDIGSDAYRNATGES